MADDESRLDEFLASTMTPTLEEAGFRRKRRSYLLQSPSGAAVYVTVRPYHVGWLAFHVDWAPTPAILREYHADHGSAEVSLNSGLFYTRLRVPLDLRDIPYDGTLWEVPSPEKYESFRHRFDDVLRTDAVPRWLAALTPEYLATAESEDPDASVLCAGGFGGPPWTPLWLGIDDADEGELERLFERVQALPNSSEKVSWLRARLQGRLDQENRDRGR